MTAIPALSGPSLTPASGAPARHLVVLLHGLGADGADLISLGEAWAEMLPAADFLAPDAPQPCDMAPFGRQWFSLREWTIMAMDRGVRQAAPALDAFLDRELAARGLPGRALALVGFSQGTMMALQVALRRPDRVAAVVGFSGALLDSAALRGEIRSRPPVLLVHGDADPVVPFISMALAQTALAAHGVPVETLARPGLGHGIDPEGLAQAGAFLKRHLGA